MLSRFATVLHNAVDALAPPISPKEEFIYHWKAVTNFFVDKRSDSKAPIEETNIPGHLEEMFIILTNEDQETVAGNMGPCLEFLLQHKLLDTLQTLARADCPPGMKQNVLIFFSKLLKRIQQPLLPHINAHLPVHRLIKLCGEIKAAPTENEEISFLCIICAKLKENPYLVNFLMDASSKSSGTSSTDIGQPFVEHSLAKSLLILCESADNHVSLKACEGLMLCASLSVETAAQCFVNHTRFLELVTCRLVKLFEEIPRTLDLEDLDAAYAKWGNQVVSAPADDPATFAGKKQLEAFLSWLDFVDLIVQDAYPVVGIALSAAVHENFLKAVIEPILLSELISDSTWITAFIIKCIRHVSSVLLITEIGKFLLGVNSDAENRGVMPHAVKRTLLERCSDPDEDLMLITLKLFETLVEVPNEQVLQNLVLANLESRDYYDGTCVDYQQSWSDEEDERMRKRSHEVDFSEESSPVNTSRTFAPSNINKIINCFLMLLPEELTSESEDDLGYDSYLRDAHLQFEDAVNKCSSFDWPQEAISKEEQHQSDCSSSESQAEADKNYNFYEGPFLAMLFEKLLSILDQPYQVNLRITSILAKLALLPHPNLHEFLLNPLIPLNYGVRTLFSVLDKVINNIQVKVAGISNFQRKLYLTRRVLLDETAEYSSIENANIMESLIVLEEFLKELAAIAFVKYHAAASH